jgi:hypothetical protein
MCIISRSSSTRHEIIRSHFRKRNDLWSTCSRIITFCLKILIFIISFKTIRRNRRSCNNKCVFKHNKKTQFNINVIREMYHVKKSHNNKHYRFHVYDVLFDQQIKTLHDEIWFESIIESYIDLNLYILRNRVKLISNLSKKMKIDQFKKNQKNWKKDVNFVTLIIDSRNQWICVWNSKFLQSIIKKIVF